MKAPGAAEVILERLEGIGTFPVVMEGRPAGLRPGRRAAWGKIGASYYVA
jgi:hypothetical protein